MVLCKHCNTPNSLDSTFCKRCGTGLPEDDISEAKAKLEVILAEGVARLNEGKVEEAMAIAESSVISDPSSVMALTLKANCHERRGEIAEALECAEQIVDLNPDSDLDKIRRNQLRSALVLHARPAPQSDRKLAVIGAVAATLLVVCLGALIAKVSREPVEKPVASLSGLERQPNQDLGQQSVQQPSTQTNPGTNQPATQTNTATPTTDQTGQQNPPADRTEAPLDTKTSPWRPGDIGNQLPLPGNSGNTIVTPTNPAPKKQTDNQRNGAENPGSDPSPVPGPAPTPPKEEPEAVQGEYKIEVSKGGGRKVNGGSETVNPTGGSKAYFNVANDQYLLGNYARAAVNFEQSLRSGGDPTRINMRLGQAYQKMGKKSEAANAYQRAITACDKAIASGRGDKESLQATRETCQSYLRVVQGG